MVTTGQTSIQSNQEIFVKANRIYIDDDKIVVSLNGEIEGIEAIKIKKAILEILATFKNKAELIINFQHAKLKSKDSKQTFESFWGIKQIAKVNCVGADISVHFLNYIRRCLFILSKRK